MASREHLAAELARLDQELGQLQRPAGDPAEIAALSARLRAQAESTRTIGGRAASLPESMDFVGPAAARYHAVASTSGAAAGSAAARLQAIADDLLTQSSRLQGSLDRYQGELRQLTTRRDAVAAQLRSGA